MNEQPINEVEKLSVEALPQVVSTLLSLARRARKPSERARAVLKLSELVVDLAHAAKRSETFRGRLSRHALLENAEALKEYFESCEKAKERGAKQA
jgi:hypothetical protein